MKERKNNKIVLLVSDEDLLIMEMLKEYYQDKENISLSRSGLIRKAVKDLYDEKVKG